MNFFMATKLQKELLLLQHIEENPNTTQKAIAQAIGGAPSTVNEYMEDLEENKYLKRDYKTPKTVDYNITPEGIKRKNYLSIRYIHELLELYTLAEKNLEKFFTGLEEKGFHKILIYGAGEVAETILGILKNRKNNSIEILAMVDDDKERQATKKLGYKIISREEIKNYDHDGIVITSYTFEDEIRKKLEEIDYPGDRIERFFTE